MTINLFNKPVVEYSGKPVIQKDYNGKEYAILQKVYNHPRLGTLVNVFTSEVRTYNSETNEIETRNTIYKQRKD